MSLKFNFYASAVYFHILFEFRVFSKRKFFDHVIVIKDA